MNQVQSIPNQSQIPKNGQSLGDFSGPGPSNPQNSDRLRADFGPSNPQYRGQPYIGASGVLEEGSLCAARLPPLAPPSPHLVRLQIELSHHTPCLPHPLPVFTFYNITVYFDTMMNPHTYQTLRNDPSSGEQHCQCRYVLSVRTPIKS